MKSSIFLRFFKDAFYILLISLLLGEIILRIFGYRPYKQIAFSINSIPNKAIIPDEAMGFALNPGFYTTTINDSLKYTATHLADSSRNNGTAVGFEKIHIYGCSFTYGMGVNDSLTFPFLLQELSTKTSIKNFAVPGYGNLHALIQLRKNLEKGQKPNQVVISYASFHDERNVMAPPYRQHLQFAANNTDKKSGFPYIKNPNSREVHYYLLPEKKFLRQMRHYFAVANLLWNTNDFVRSKMVDQQAVTLSIMEEIHSICKKNNIKLLIVGLVDDQGTKNALHGFEAAGISILDMGLAINENEFNNMPYDSHPNAKAHRIYATRLFKAMQP